MIRIWYNHGYSQTRDALALLKQADHVGLVLVATHASILAPVFLAADEYAVEPELGGDADQYVDWCLSFAVDRAIAVFVPQRGRSAIARRIGDFAAQGVRVLLAADADMLEVIDDKARLYQVAAAAGLPTPIAVAVRSLPAFDHALSSILEQGLEACIKPPRGVFGAGYWRLRDDVSLFEQLMDPDAREMQTQIVRQALGESGPDTPPLLVMQYLPGQEWSVDCICRDGRLIQGIARRKTGSTQVLETRGPAMTMAARVAEVFSLSNLVNIQLKSSLSEEDVPHLLEINPRMSGGCLYAHLGGLNLPHLQLLNALDRLPDTLPSEVSEERVIGAIAGAVDLTPLLRREHA